MKHVVSRTLVGVVGFGVALSGAALPAAAAAPDGATAFSTTGVAPSTAVASDYLAGYDKDPKKKLKDSFTKFDVPEVTCPNTDLQGILLGAGAEVALGVPTAIAGVFVACLEGTPYYQLSASVGTTEGAGDLLNVGAGDTLTATLVYGGGQATATVENLDSGELITATDDLARDKATTFGAFPLFDAATGDLLPVPDFGKAKFKNSKVNGDKVKSATKYNRKDGDVTQIKTGKLNKGDFTLTFKNN